MRDNELDPGASTQMFRAFVEREDSQSGKTETGGKRLLVVGLLVAVVAAALIGFLLL